MDDAFQEIRQFYGALDAHLQSRPSPTNACGTCFECCKYNFYLSRHEFDAIEDHLIRSGTPVNIRWVNCSLDIQDARRRRPVDPDYRCPLYAEGVGCTVYEVRPVACRTLGPMLPFHSKLPDWCVYESPQVYRKSDEIPLWGQLLELIHRRGAASRGYFEALPHSGPSAAGRALDGSNGPSPIQPAS